MECTPVGTVSTPFETTTEAPMQGAAGDAEGTVEVDPEYHPAIEGLEPGQEVVVVWFADRADRSVLQVRDRGVFSTRSPARPNPVCLTTCRVRSVDAGSIRVRGVDMADGSPVIDLKRPLQR
jgi:tRNA-Thr(GGU) m(6)t(6)A37 methyltransferase TsaA